jgi:flagellar motor switch protein FliN/FliY
MTMPDNTPDTSDAMAAQSSPQPSDIETGPTGASGDAAPAQVAPQPDTGEGPLADLPAYARGLMQIRVPVRVTLASQRKSIQEIIELGPGSIVKFDKTCDEPLELCVGERPIATGEVVKVGDKFGLRVGALLAP